MIYQATTPTSHDLDALGKRKPNTAKNSLDDFHDILVKKPWGSEYLLFENFDVAVWILAIEAMQQTSMHCHPSKNTSLIVLEGEANCVTMEQEYRLPRQHGLYIGKQVFHRSTNSGNNRILMMEIESPVDKYDLVRLKDSYGRESFGYEGVDAFSKQKGLTFERDFSNLSARITRIGKSEITIGFAHDLKELEAFLGNVSDAILTILDRHVWTTEGNKFYEVGQAFKFCQNDLIEFNINKGFHFLLINGKKT